MPPLCTWFYYIDFNFASKLYQNGWTCLYVCQTWNQPSPMAQSCPIIEWCGIWISSEYQFWGPFWMPTIQKMVWYVNGIRNLDSWSIFRMTLTFKKWMQRSPCYVNTPSFNLITLLRSCSITYKCHRIPIWNYTNYVKLLHLLVKLMTVISRKFSFVLLK